MLLLVVIVKNVISFPKGSVTANTRLIPAMVNFTITAAIAPVSGAASVTIVTTIARDVESITLVVPYQLPLAITVENTQTGIPMMKTRMMKEDA